MNDIRLTVAGITENNRRDKFLAATESLSKAMGLPLTIKPRDEEYAEDFVFKAEEDLVDGIAQRMGETLDAVYATVCDVFDLPLVTTFSKSIEDESGPPRPVSEAIWYHGKILFNPETGKPIYRADFEKVIKALERFLSKRIDNEGRKIVLDSVALGRVMARKLMENPSAELWKVPLKEVEYQKRSVDWLAEDLARQDKLFGPASPDEREQMIEHYHRVAEAVELGEQSIGDHITKIEDDTKHAVRRTIVDGIASRESKSQIAQNLFNKMGELNRDWRRIAETETVNTFDNAFLREQAATAKAGEKLYFKRMEMRDGYVCGYCSKIRGLIALWVDHPLDDDKIDDPIAPVAIWEGKSNIGRKQAAWWAPAGVVHPWCRGSWMRYFPSPLANKKKAE